MVKARWYELVTTSPRCYKLSEVMSQSVSNKKVSKSVGMSITRCIHYVEYATQARDELNYISTYLPTCLTIYLPSV